MQLGLDCLGLARFPQSAIDALPTGYALGVFSRTFGDAMPNVKAVVNAGKCKALRVQLMWSDSHSFSDNDIPTLKAEAERWGHFAANHKQIQVYLSPFCEHELPNPDKYLKIVKQHAPNCLPVNSSSKGHWSQHFINEVHGTGNPPGGDYIFSFDGTDMLDSDVEGYKRRHKNARIWFGWTANFNGVPEAETKNKLPREQRKDWPTSKLITSMRYVVEHAKEAAKLPTNWLWKSHAEDTGTGDPRTNKPCLIAPVKAPFAELVKAGKVVSKAPYYGPFIDGRSRYYFPEWGFELAQKQGSPLLDLRINGKIFGQVNPAFRDGEFR